jgi:hypothetical protein
MSRKAGRGLEPMENTDLGKAEKRIDQTIKKAVKAGKWPFAAFVGNKWVKPKKPEPIPFEPAPF